MRGPLKYHLLYVHRMCPNEALVNRGMFTLPLDHTKSIANEGINAEEDPNRECEGG